MESTTLRTQFGLDTRAAALSDATVILIDYQNTYTAGALELDGWEPALDAAADLLTRARRVGAPVIHVVNDSGPGSPFDPDSERGRIHPTVEPLDSEPILAKGAPNAFVGTDLLDRVRAAATSDLVIAGFMTNMCVTFTSEGAFLNGYSPTIVADACATRSLRTSVGSVSSDQLHKAALATIGDLYGVIVRTAAELN